MTSYIAVRALGDIVKLSIHRDGRCQLGFTSEYAPETLARFGVGVRHWERWTLPAQPAVLRILRILVPQSDLRAFTERHDNDLKWLPAPANDSIGVVTVLLAPPKNQALTPQGADLVGTVQTNLRSAWVFYVRHAIDPALAQTIVNERSKLEGVPRPRTIHSGTRAILWSSGGHDRQALELAYETPQVEATLIARFLKKIRCFARR